MSDTVIVPQTGHAVVEIVTSSLEEAQGALDIVHLNIALPAASRPVTPEVGEPGVVMLAFPETFVQLPIPSDGVFPDNVAILTPQAGLISVPAIAIVGGAFIVIVIVFDIEGEPVTQFALEVITQVILSLFDNDVVEYVSLVAPFIADVPFFH